MFHNKRLCPPIMPRFLRWVPIVFAILSVSCATGQDVWNKYEAGGQHRAYATGNKGVVGAAWNYPTSEQAIAAAINLCNREGEIGCHVTHLNGKPYNKTSPKKSEVTQPKPAPTPQPVSAPKSVSTPESAPAPKPVFTPDAVATPPPAPLVVYNI